MFSIRLGLFLKFTVVMGLLALLPVTFHAYRLAAINKKGLEAAVLELHIKAAEKLAKQVDDYIKHTEDKISFALTAIGKDMAWADKQALLQSLIEADADILEISILNAEGRELMKVYNPALSSGGRLASRAKEIGFKRFLATHRRSLSISREANALELYYPMNAGVLMRISVSLRGLASDVSSEIVGGSGFAVLVDEKGVPLLFSRERLSEELALQVPAWRIVTASLASKSVGSSEFTDRAGRGFVGAYAPVSSLGGAVIILQPKAEAYLASSEMRRSSVLVLVMVLVLALLTATYMARRLTAPLLALTRGAEAVARGNLHTNVSVATRDELQDLAETFNRMVSQLRGYAEIQVDRLVSEQRKTEAILFSIDDGIVLSDDEKHIQLANRRALELLGLEEKDVLGNKSLAEALDGSPLRDAILRSSEEAVAGAVREIGVPMGKSVRHVRITGRPVISPGTGAAMGTLLALRDVTLEKELDKLKETFLQSITHDLRNPLGAVIGFLDALLKNMFDELSPRQRVAIASIYRSANRLMGMINNILDIAKMESGRLKLNLSPLKLAEVAAKSMANLESLSRQKNIDVVLDMPADLGLKGDGDLLERAFNNLLGNAIKFTPTGGRIVLSAVDAGAMIQACVADNGEGVPAAYREKIFEKFEQVAGQKRKGGTGLGLTITKAFVEAHGGRIWVESEDMKGSRFLFTLAKNLALFFLLLLAPVVSFAEQPADTVFQSVVVKPGDTLWSISNKYLADPSNWDQILKHNRLPSSDPTVALPGMTLRVPVRLIREDLRAAALIYVLNTVVYRRKATAVWAGALENMELFRDDTLKTAEDSKAKVKFLDGDLLQLDANSMAVIKPVNRDYAVELKRGGRFVGKSNVLTAAGKVTALTRNTKYSATVREDLSTLVEVLRGKAAVEASGLRQEVIAGMASEIKLGSTPSLPTRIVDFPEFQARLADFEGNRAMRPPVVALRAPAAATVNVDKTLEEDLRSAAYTLRVGEAISGYRIQFSLDRDFAEIVSDRTFSSDEPIRLASIRLDSGRYWYRVAVIDLLGVQGKFSSPKPYER